MSATEEFLVTSPAGPTGSGKQKRVRLAEAFFRRWPLLLIPVVLLAAFGAYSATKITKVFRSVGTISVTNSTPLDVITNGNTPSFGYDTPATTTSREINELMGTDAFATTVAQNAGLTDTLKNGQITLLQVRSYVGAAASGDNLVTMSASSPYPDLSQKLTASLLKSYRDHVLTAETAGLTGAITFLDSQLADAEAKVDTANAALDDYVQQHPSPITGARPDDEALQLQRLNSTVASAQKQLDAFQSNLDQLNLQLKQSQSETDQRLQVVDEPQVPAAPESIKMQQLLSFVIFSFLGVGVALSALIVMALVDHSVRTTADITGVPGLKVLAAIPMHQTRSRSSKRRSTKRRATAAVGKRGA